ncbi:hypothetical protein OQA88_1104 [Cercophora sp. LCS_1]
MHLPRFVAIGLAFTSRLGSCAPQAETQELEVSDGRKLPVVGTLQWQGPAFPDGPNITLSGTPESVHGGLLKVNPKYDAWDMPGYAEEAARLGLSRIGAGDPNTLEARQWGEVVCGNSAFNVVWGLDCEMNYNYLRLLGGGCFAFYFCDKTGNGIWGACLNIAQDMAHIYGICAGFSITGGNGRRVFGGHETQLIGRRWC